MELDLPIHRTLTRPSRFSALVSLDSAKRSGVLLSADAPPRAALSFACRLLGRRALRLAAPLVVRADGISAEELPTLLCDATSRLRARGLAMSLLGLELDPTMSGFEAALACAAKARVVAVVRISTRTLAHDPKTVEAVYGLARARGATVHVADITRVEEITEARRANAAWVSGPALGGDTPSPRPLGAPQRALVDVALHTPTNPVALARRELLDCESELQALLPSISLFVNDDLTGLLERVADTLHESFTALDTAERTSARAAAYAHRAAGHLAMLLDRIANGRPAGAQALLEAEVEVQDARSLQQLASTQLLDATARAHAARAAATLRLQAARAALDARARGVVRAEPSLCGHLRPRGSSHPSERPNVAFVEM